MNINVNFLSIITNSYQSIIIMKEKIEKKSIIIKKDRSYRYFQKLYTENVSKQSKRS